MIHVATRLLYQICSYHMPVRNVRSLGSTVNKSDRQCCWPDANADADRRAGQDSQIFRQPTSINLCRGPSASSYRVWPCVKNWTPPGIRIHFSWDVTLRSRSSGSRPFERYLSRSPQTILLGLFETEDQGNKDLPKRREIFYQQHSVASYKNFRQKSCEDITSSAYSVAI